MGLISVVIPTFNRLQSLPRACRSVMAQTFTDWDLWIVDDFSTDGTRAWLQQLKSQDPRVHIILTDNNRGVSASRNLAIRQSSGEWLALLDSDDEWVPHKLEEQLKLVQRENLFRLLHSDEIWIRNGVRVNPHRKHYKGGGEIFKDCIDMCRISPSAAMIHRQLFEAYGLFDEDLPVCEDYDLWLRITRHEQVGFCDKKLTLKYGGHEDQLSNRFHSMDYWRLKSLSRYFSDRGLQQDVRSYLLETALRKADILIQGYQKHHNLTNLGEVLSWRDIILNEKNESEGRTTF